MAAARKSRYVGKHRAEQLPVRRWLQLGAASAGVGAALVGWSLVGPQVHVAFADSADQGSASAGPASSPGQGAKGAASAPSASDGAHSGAPSSTVRTAARTSVAGPDDGESAGTSHRSPSSTLSAQRTATSATPGVAGSSSVADRLAASTSLSSRVAERVDAVASPSSNPLAAVQAALGRQTASAQPDLGPGAKVTFVFNYTKGAEYWTPARRAELEQSAVSLSQYFAAPVPITIRYNVTGDNNPNSRTLASAGSPLISNDPGFYSTVVQEKFISGLDLNGPADDGEINFNFGQNYGLGYKIGKGDFDFVSTAEHELMHSLGFLSNTGKPGTNTGNTWATFDKYVVNSLSVSPFDSDYRFDASYNPNLIGRNFGMYFGGPNAVDAYGQLVPLFTPNPYSVGSSMSHLDDYTFSGPNKLMMTSGDGTGNGRRTLSAIEQGIMADLGYRVRFQAPAPYAAPAPSTAG
jgi:hypothetical protein